jgi:hypothetical protein
VWHWFRQGKVHSWQVGMTAGMLTWFALAGLGRLQYGAGAAGESRYVYVGTVFLLPLLADAASELPWRRLWRPALVAVFTIALLSNIAQLRERALVDVLPTLGLTGSQVESMQIEKAELQTVEVFRGAPDMNLNRSIDDRIMPQLNAGPYLAAVAELGSPVPPATIDTLSQLPPQAVDTVMVNLFGGSVKVSPDNSRSTLGLICHSVDSTIGSVIDLKVPDGQSFVLQSSKGGDATLFLGFIAPPKPEPLQQIHLLPATQEWLYLPDTGKSIVWRLRIQIKPVDTVRLCTPADVQINPAAGNFAATAAPGTLSPGWSAVSDLSTRSGQAAKATGGTFVSYQSIVFGVAVVPVTQQYDVWYRVRVNGTSDATPQMLLGLWDDEGTMWAGLSTLRSDQIRATYSWVRVATAITPTPGHHVQFIAAFIGRLNTDWYIDSAVLVSTGSLPPA